MLDPSISYSTNRFTSNGSQTTFELSFAGGYISQSNVKAYYVNDLDQIVLVTLNFIGTNTVSISSPIPSGKVLVVYRDTPKDAPLVDFQDGTIINEKNLDKLAKQAILATGEMLDRFNETITTNKGDIQDFTTLIEGELAVVQDGIDAVNAEFTLINSNIAAANTTAASAVTIANSAVTTANASNVTAGTALATANTAKSTADATAAQFASLLATVNSIAGVDFTGFVQTTGDQTIGGNKTFSNAIKVGPTGATQVTFSAGGTFTINGTTRTLNAWADITGKPPTYTPSAHTHTKADITDLSLNISDIVGLTAALAGKQTQDSDLDSIAALSTTSFGRSLLTSASSLALAGAASVIGDVCYTAGSAPSGFVLADGSSYLASAYPTAAAMFPTAPGTGATTAATNTAFNPPGFNRAAATGGSTVVTVGDNGAVHYSTDGGTLYVGANSTVTVTLRGVCWTGTAWIAVGDNGTIITSPDAIVWTVQTSPVTDNLRSVTYDAGSNTSIAVGDGGRILRSAGTTGVTWATVTSPHTTTYYSVSTDGVGSVFIAGTNGAFAYNPSVNNTNGFAGATRGSVNHVQILWNAGNNLWLLINNNCDCWYGTTAQFKGGSQSTSLNSANGLSGRTASCIGRNGGQFVVCASGQIFYSTDGGSWSYTGGFSVSYCASYRASGGWSGFPVGSLSNLNYVSSGDNPASYSTASNPFGPRSAMSYAASKGDGTIVVGGASGVHFVRPSGLTIPVLNSATAVVDILWDGTAYIAACAAGAGQMPMYTSPDGTTWTLNAAGNTGEGAQRLLKVPNGVLLVTTSGRVLFSTNSGLNWTVAATGLPTAVAGMACIGSKACILQTDGTVWTASQSSSWATWSSSYSSVAFAGASMAGLIGGNGMAVAYSSGGSTKTYLTYDFVSWTAVGAVGNNAVRGTYYGGAFVIAINQGVIVSKDGKSWVGLNSGGGQTAVTSGVYDPATSRFVFVGTGPNSVAVYIPFTAVSPAAFSIPYIAPQGAVNAYLKIQ